MPDAHRVMGVMTRHVVIIRAVCLWQLAQTALILVWINAPRVVAAKPVAEERKAEWSNSAAEGALSGTHGIYTTVIL